MPAGSKPAKSVPQPFFEASDIFKIVSRQQAAHRNIDTDLTAGVWGHMVLVLGPLPIYEGYWRIMTITTKAHNTDDFIPFKNAPLAQHRMQLELGREIPFTRASYLRTKEEYWIEERGLLERVGHVRLRGPRGMNSDEEESDGDTDEENTDEGESDENYAEDKIDGQGEQMPSWARYLMVKMNETNERLIALELGMRMGKMRI